MTYDHKLLEDMIEIITPFETATHCVQCDRVITSSLIIPCTCICVLKTTVETLYCKFPSRFVAPLKESVSKRLAQYDNFEAFFLASALDPCFKLRWCSPDEFSSIKANLILKGKSRQGTSNDSNLDLDTASGAPESFKTVSKNPQKPSLTFF